MKFKLSDEHLYWWPVEVKKPDPDKAGKLKVEKLEMLFAAVPEDEAKKQQEEFAKLNTDVEREAHQRKILKLVCRDWRDVVGDDDEAIPFSQSVFDQFMQLPWHRTALYRAYGQSLTGDEARLGN